MIGSNCVIKQHGRIFVTRHFMKSDKFSSSGDPVWKYHYQEIKPANYIKHVCSWGGNIPVKLCQYHGCWCPGFRDARSSAITFLSSGFRQSETYQFRGIIENTNIFFIKARDGLTIQAQAPGARLVKPNNYWNIVPLRTATDADRSVNTLRPKKNNRHSQTTFSSAFSWIKKSEFRLRSHWNLFLRLELTIFHHWFRKWLAAVQATIHYLYQWWLDYRRIYALLGLNELNNQNWQCISN